MVRVGRGSGNWRARDFSASHGLLDDLNLLGGLREYRGTLVGGDVDRINALLPHLRAQSEGSANGSWRVVVLDLCNDLRHVVSD